MSPLPVMFCMYKCLCIIGLANEGWFDPWLYLSALKIKCMSLGVKFTKGEVIGFDSEDKVCGSSTTAGAIQRRKELMAVKVNIRL